MPNLTRPPGNGDRRRTSAGLLRSAGRALPQALFWILAAVAAVWLIHPWPLLLRWLDPGTTSYMEHRVQEARETGEELEVRWSWVPLDQMSPHLERAVLIAEDHRFREHRGVDWEALAEETRYRGGLPPNLLDAEDREALREAVGYVREHRDRVRGRSTLTQQLARNLYLSPRRTFFRKAQELLIARRLELVLSKDRILEIYLNVAELGPGIFGVEAAAQAHFGRSAAELSPHQAAALAATLPHPRTSNPSLNPGRMAWRQALILERMGLAGPPEGIPAPDDVEILPPVLPDTLDPDTADVRGDALPAPSDPWGDPAPR